MLWRRLIFLVALAELAIAATLILFAGSDSPEPGRIETERSVERTRRYIDHQSGLSLDYPAAWRIERGPSITKLFSPNRAAVVAFMHKDKASLLDDGDDLLDLVRASYRRVEIRSSDVTSIDGSLAVVYRGRAHSGSDTSLGFRLAVIEAPETNIAMISYVKQMESALLPPLASIWDSVSLAGA